MSKLPKKVDELIDKVYKSSNKVNKKHLDELVRTLHSSMVPAVQGGEMRVESMVASQSKMPVCIFSWNNNRGELSPVQARGYAMQILEAAEAATQDAALYAAVTGPINGDENMAFGLITAVRDHRRKFEGAEE